MSLRYVWIVGSQQGYMNNLDDCIIHGVFTNRGAAQACINDLQQASPMDTFGCAQVQLDTEVFLGYSINHGWEWLKPLTPDDDNYTTDNLSVSLIPPEGMSEPSHTGLLDLTPVSAPYKKATHPVPVSAPNVFTLL